MLLALKETSETLSTLCGLKSDQPQAQFKELANMHGFWLQTGRRALGHATEFIWEQSWTRGRQGHFDGHSRQRVFS